MNVIITAHQAATNGDPGLHTFTFHVEGGGVTRSQRVAVRTVEILARELHQRTGLDAMMHAIAEASPSNYDTLVGTRYQDT